MAAIAVAAVTTAILGGVGIVVLLLLRGGEETTQGERVALAAATAAAVAATTAAAAAMVSGAGRQKEGIFLKRGGFSGPLPRLLAPISIPSPLVFRTTDIRGGEYPRKRLLLPRTQQNVVVIVAEVASAWWCMERR